MAVSSVVFSDRVSFTSMSSILEGENNARVVDTYRRSCRWAVCVILYLSQKIVRVGVTTM